MYLDDLVTDIIIPLYIIVLIIISFVFIIYKLKIELRNEDDEKSFKDNCIQIEEKYYCEIN